MLVQACFFSLCLHCLWVEIFCFGVKMRDVTICSSDVIDRVLKSVVSADVGADQLLNRDLRI